jgi:YD repeat-containing protein
VCTGTNKQTRTFSYDSLGRLKQAENPEMSALSYTYDTAGNLVTKAYAGGATTCFGTWSGSSCDGAGGYDALNRVLKKSYSDGTATVTYTYDACANGKGRVCSVVNAEATRSYGYNAMGWVSSSSQKVGSTTYSFSP